MLVALSIGAICAAFRGLIFGTPAGSVPWWSALVLAVFFIALAIFLNRGLYIRVDEFTITFAPNQFRHTTFPRRDVARIRGVTSGFYGELLLLRSDGSTVASIPGVLWGRAGAQALADYLHVPFEGSQRIRS